MANFQSNGPHGASGRLVPGLFSGLQLVDPSDRVHFGLLLPPGSADNNSVPKLEGRTSNESLRTERT